jgi:hypothetical protein
MVFREGRDVDQAVRPRCYHTILNHAGCAAGSASCVDAYVDPAATRLRTSASTWRHLNEDGRFHDVGSVRCFSVTGPVRALDGRLSGSTTAASAAAPSAVAPG